MDVRLGNRLRVALPGRRGKFASGESTESTEGECSRDGGIAAVEGYAPEPAASAMSPRKSAPMACDILEVSASTLSDIQPLMFGPNPEIADNKLWGGGRRLLLDARPY